MRPDFVGQRLSGKYIFWIQEAPIDAGIILLTHKVIGFYGSEDWLAPANLLPACGIHIGACFMSAQEHPPVGFTLFFFLFTAIIFVPTTLPYPAE